MENQALRELLMELAGNYRWSWRADHLQMLESLPGADSSTHPILTVRALTDPQLSELASDRAFVERVEQEVSDIRELRAQAPAPSIGYFSMEFGISSLFHQYAGGLGVLAGDHLKAASDAGLGLVGIGLYYGRGAFHQEISAGCQIEIHLQVAPEDVGAADTGLVVEVPLAGATVLARVLRVEVGAVSLILLDTDVDGNSEEYRAITDCLYLGSAEKRVAQEMVLGVGGARALAALGFDIELFHLNEGHAGFVALELIDRVIGDGNLSGVSPQSGAKGEGAPTLLDVSVPQSGAKGEGAPTQWGRGLRERVLSGAVAEVRNQVVFTTHTPVSAGIDCLTPGALRPHLEFWAERWDVDIDRIWDLGSDPNHIDEFNMAIFCLRMSRKANGVSELHGEVSRQLFSQIPEGRAITHVTNGVHARTWTAGPLQVLFDEVLGENWDRGDQSAWDRVTEISDQVLVGVRSQGSEHLAKFLIDRGISVDPDALIVGFARRFAPYKRSALILRERERLTGMLADSERPIHFLFSGKAHPANLAGLALIEEVLDFSMSDAANGRFSFIPDYDMEVGAALVQGCDIWLNNPIRLHEASGTSGEKVALNGGLNISILDGWWAEMYDVDNGWAIPTSSSEDSDRRDDEEAAGLMQALLSARDEYFDDRARLNKRIRHAWRSLGPQVTAARMLRDYRERIYDTSA